MIKWLYHFFLESTKRFVLWSSLFWDFDIMQAPRNGVNYCRIAAFSSWKKTNWSMAHLTCIQQIELKLVVLPDRSTTPIMTISENPDEHLLSYFSILIMWLFKLYVGRMKKKRAYAKKSAAQVRSWHLYERVHTIFLSINFEVNNNLFEVLARRGALRRMKKLLCLTTPPSVFCLGLTKMAKTVRKMKCTPLHSCSESTRVY